MKKGEVQLSVKMTSSPPLLQKKKKTISMKFLYEVEEPKKGVKKKISFNYTVGPYLTDKDQFTQIDKKAKKPKGVLYPLEFEKKISAILKKYTVEEATITGYADSRGTELHNKGLGLRRATNFAKFLQAIPDIDRKNTFVDPKTRGEAPGSTTEEDNPSQRVVVVKILASQK
ncbi:hypothetical protein FGK64_11755 [Arenibacterium halophilum]|uniref:OmpA family protein n=2 Tax=Arenibacterium halophilum TaxID=2583821 RepID=A0ABY2XBK0_9RHOB|nr:hypothetical protein FGK64_11755 [Arenibacterium halophilum]